MHRKQAKQVSYRAAGLSAVFLLAAVWVFSGFQSKGTAAAASSPLPAWVFASQRTFEAGTSAENFEGKQVRLVTFTRPITPIFRSVLHGSGLEIVEHIPSLSYLVYGNATSLKRLRQGVQAKRGVKWRMDGDVSGIVITNPYAPPPHRANLPPMVISDAAFAMLLLPDRIRNKAPKNKVVDVAAVENVDYTPQRWKRLVDSQVSGEIPGRPIKPAAITSVNFEARAAEGRRTASEGPQEDIAIPNQIVTELEPQMPGEPQDQNDPSANIADDVQNPLIPSPAPATTFLGQEDGPRIGGGSTIPPDTFGAVGIDKVFSNTNQNFRVQDKVTGAALSTVSSQTFWAPSGGSGFFDPRVVFDPYNQRWVMAIVSNGSSVNSSVSIAVSQTSDPLGNYHIYRFVMGCAAGATGCHANGEWADFPILGFNKNWIAVTVNMFTISGGQSVRRKLVLMDYPAARSGTSTATEFVGTNIDFCASPVQTFSEAESILYMPSHISSGSAAYRMSTITGTPSAPVVNVGATRTRPGGGWTQPSGDTLPQMCTGTPGVDCPVTMRLIDAGDAYIRSNAVLRNGSVYYAQSIGLSTAGLPRTAVQWTKLGTEGEFADGGRIDDPVPTDLNRKWYAFPSIAVNSVGDMLVGFSQFASNQFASAGYAFRGSSDAAGTIRDPLIYKAGEDYYAKIFSGTRNRWGDYSHTMVDPSNDLDLWTVQQYAQPRTSPNPDTVTNSSRWGTWWAKVSLAPTSPTAFVTGRVTSPDSRGMANILVTLTDSAGVIRTVTTSSFGIYTFTDVATGQSYTVVPRSRKFKWGPPRSVTVNDNLTEINFRGEE